MADAQTPRALAVDTRSAPIPPPLKPELARELSNKRVAEHAALPAPLPSPLPPLASTSPPPPASPVATLVQSFSAGAPPGLVRSQSHALENNNNNINSGASGGSHAHAHASPLPALPTGLVLGHARSLDSTPSRALSQPPVGALVLPPSSPITTSTSSPPIPIATPHGSSSGLSLMPAAAASSGSLLNAEGTPDTAPAYEQLQPEVDIDWTSFRTQLNEAREQETVVRDLFEFRQRELYIDVQDRTLETVKPIVPVRNIASYSRSRSRQPFILIRTTCSPKLSLLLLLLARWLVGWLAGWLVGWLVSLHRPSRTHPN